MVEPVKISLKELVKDVSKEAINAKYNDQGKKPIAKQEESEGNFYK
jgi:hypothetical protein